MTNLNATNLEDYYQKVDLRNHQPAVIRAITLNDKTLLKEGFERTSEQSVYNRFLGKKGELTNDDLRYLTEIELQNHVAIVVCVTEQGRELLIGVGRYLVFSDASVAEIAFSVDDKHQNIGVGTLLFQHLVKIAKTQEIRKLRGEMWIENTKILEIFRQSGFDLNMEVKAGVASVEFSI